MGLEVQHILSDEAHYCDYECLICQCLVDLDCLVTTVCSHCFCRTCLYQWLSRKTENMDPSHESMKTCPTCNKDLLYAHLESGSSARYLPTMMIGSDCFLVQPLEKCQPLAHRVLKRIKVSCPLQGVHCGWQGDYSGLSEHLLSRTAHIQEANRQSPPQQSQQHQTTATSASVHSSKSSAQSSNYVSIDDTEMDLGQDEPRVVGDNDDSPSERMRLTAESFKEQANTKFASQHYQQARDLYSQALNFLAVRPASDEDDRNLDLLEATLLSNRAACHFALKAYSAAIVDAEQALQRDPTYVKAILRVARSNIQLGNFGKAVECLEQGMLEQATCPHPQQQLLSTELIQAKQLQQSYKECLSFLSQKDFPSAKLSAGTLLRITRAESVLLAAAQADLGLGLTDSAARFSLAVLKENPQSVNAYFVRGQASMLSNDLETGANLLKQGIRLDPDGTTNRDAEKRWIQLANRIKQARNDFFHRRFDVCVETLDQIIPVCPLLPPKSVLYATLHIERAQSRVRRKEYEAALKDCALVLYHQDDHVEAWLTKFSALHSLARHEEVLDETSALMRKWGQGNERIGQAWQRADFEVRKAKRPDFYKILGVSSVASEREIRKAYRQKSKDCHPDRFAGAEYTDAQRQEARRNFQHLGDALEVLTHEFSRQLYDEGYDIEAIKERFEAAQRAARQQKNPHGGGGGGSYPHHH